MNLRRALFKYASDFEGDLYSEKWFIPSFDLIAYKNRYEKTYLVYKHSNQDQAYNPYTEMKREELESHFEKLILANKLKHDLLINEQKNRQGSFKI